MDRSVLESDPHRVLEGMIIAGYAVGASQGYIYVRAEYPLAIKRLQTAIREARRLGFLGSQICSAKFSFDVKSESAAVHSCAGRNRAHRFHRGRRGTPRPRPPFPSQSGLWELPR